MISLFPPAFILLKIYLPAGIKPYSGTKIFRASAQESEGHPKKEGNIKGWKK